MVKITYEDWSNLPKKQRFETTTNHITIKEAEKDFIKRNWGKPFKIVSLELLNNF